MVRAATDATVRSYSEPVAKAEKRPIQAPSASPNRTLPIFQSAVAPERKLSSTPTDGEITAYGGFVEPLVPVAGKTTATDNKAMGAFLTAWQKRTDSEDFSLIDDFLAKHPRSPWATALLLNKGLECRKHGYFSIALVAWEDAWNRGKNEKESGGHALVDRAAGELAELNARLGRYEWLEPFFKELEGRTIQGSATEKIAGARQGLWLMQNKPEAAFRCGPMALDRIRARENPSLAFDPKVIASRSTLKGMSLTDVNALAKDLGMDYTMVKRDAGASMAGMVPAVIHWKVGHYAALTGQNDGRYRVEDPTFGDVVTLTARAIDAEASGYFLVPTASIAKLPSGWQRLSAAEGKEVWGKGNTGASDPTRTSSTDVKLPDCADMHGMAQYSVHAMVVSLNLVDSPLWYAPPRGEQIVFKVTYNQRDASQPANFDYSNLGRKWTFDWFAYVQDDDTSADNPPIIYLAGGGSESYPQLATDNQNGVLVPRVTYAYDNSVNPPVRYVETAEYKPQQESRAVLTKTSRTQYQKTYPDGSKEIFNHLGTAANIPYPRKLFLTKRIDAAGNEILFTYDGTHRLRGVTDAIGQVTTLQYGLSSDPLRITSVTDPFNRMAILEYNPDGQLVKITDVEGLTSEFTYLTGDFINSMKTGYGTTLFSAGELGSTRWVEVTDPEGNKERTEFRQYAPGIGGDASGGNQPRGVPLFPAYLENRNTFYFSKKAYQEAYHGGTFDYTKARIYHWLHATDVNVCSGILESTKEPYENRVWLYYKGQTSPGFINPEMLTQPTSIARVLDDFTTQIHRYDYNDAGKVTRSIDPLGRETTFVYEANLVDLKEVRQKRGTSTDLVASYTYYSNHRPHTITDAAGQTTTFVYNSYGQIETIEDALHHVTTATYDDTSYLKSLVGPDPASAVNFEYDGYGRIRQVRDSDNYTIDTEYDLLNRPRRVTYPDGTYQETVYTLLDPEWIRDRLGRWTHNYFNSIRQRVGVEDPEYRFTGYEWCGCGGLSAIIDPLGRVTSWGNDAQGRVISKTYPDSRSETYQYERKSGRLSTVTSPLGSTHYEYYLDDALKKVDDTAGDRAPVSISYTYEPEYPRLQTMVDGQGTTVYTYQPAGVLGAGKVATIDGPLENDTIAVSYDELGRSSGQSINGVANTSHYDALGRMDSVTNALGTFGYHYDGVSARVTTIDLPNGQHTTFGYYDNLGDRAVSNITHLTSTGAILSKFDYAYSALRRISDWTQQRGTEPAAIYNLKYDNADQMREATLRDVATQAVVKHYAYAYDAAENRTNEQIDNLVATEVPNQVNQLITRKAGGEIKVRGALTEPARVTVNGAPARVDANNQFEGSVNVGSGNNNFEVVATDGNGNQTTQRYQLNVPAAATITQQYDGYGNLIRKTEGANATTYEWDAAGRLTAINSATGRSEFGYDGLSRRVRIVEKQSDGTVISDKRFLWSALTLAEERDSSGAVSTKRFFVQGVQIANGSNAGTYFYSRDHLGSIRQMSDNTGAVRAEYSYDLFGARAKVAGDLDADFGFTGHYYHQPSHHELALYRAYDSTSGRWISRDPIGESGGRNMYGYVHGDPVNLRDSLGLRVDVPLSDKAAYRAAWQYLIQAPAMREAFKQLNQSEKVYKLVTNTEAPVKGTFFDSIDHPGDINWNPHASNWVYNHGEGTFGSQSPAMALGHEFLHAAGWDVDPEGYKARIKIKCWDYTNMEEFRVISGPETEAARKLGETIRTDHWDWSWHWVSSPTER